LILSQLANEVLRNPSPSNSAKSSPNPNRLIPKIVLTSSSMKIKKTAISEMLNQKFVGERRTSVIYTIHDD
jgi:hypothetical protein